MLKTRERCESAADKLSQLSRSKKKSKLHRKSNKDASCDSSSTQHPQILTSQTEILISSIQAHVLPLLRLHSQNDDYGNDNMIGKNRMMFALNRAAEQALGRRDVFGTLKQLRAEAREADDIVSEILSKEGNPGMSRARLSLVAPKCALCGNPCKKCTRCNKEDGKRSYDKRSKERSPKSISWGMDLVSSFERSEGEVPGAGFYPDPDSETDEEDEGLSSTQEEVAFDPKDFLKSKEGRKRRKSESTRR